MATISININKRALLAQDDLYNIGSMSPNQKLTVMENDILGAAPTIISSIDSTGFTLGTLSIDTILNVVVYSPNGTIGTSTFSYTIEDNDGDTSTAIVTITQT